MVSERVDTPDTNEAPAQENQGIVDVTPEGQDLPSTGVVDTTAEVDTSTTDDTGTQAQPTVQTPAPTAEVPPGQVEQKQPEAVDQQSFGELRDQVRAQQEQLQYYNQLEKKAQIQREADTYKRNLENQGYLPEQAQQAADAHAEQMQQKQQLESEAEQYRQFREGQNNAAIHYAKLHKLDFDDLAILQKYNTPQEMEAEAKRLSTTRAMAKELAELKQQQVPPQNFDNNQPAASSSGSENDLLDKYNSGDRSEAAVNAARRLLGI